MTYVLGTLFWFPLRTEVALEDPISTTIYTEDKVRDLCESFQREASIVLLFLKHINQISMHKYENNHVFTEKFNVIIEAVDGQDIGEERRKISQTFKVYQKEVFQGLPSVVSTELEL